MNAAESPQDRNGFRVAIICALPLEAEMVELVLDKDWQDENKAYGKAPRDPNAYTTGVIGQHNVVLAYMPGMGSNSAATVASGVRMSFPEIEIAFVVGLCGVVPKHPQTNEEIILGDCIISTTIVQYDFGREYPLGFKRKTDIEDSIGRANPEIRSYISKLTTRRNRQNLTIRLIQHLSLMQGLYDDLLRPESKRDRLFEVSYKHEHHKTGETCNKCLLDFGTCTKDCDALGCEDSFLVPRQRLRDDASPDSVKPRIHFGRYGTANTVMKSGEKRDQINEEDDITAFEMEGSGVWDALPTILVKAACDYADSHKSKEWQTYAAAAAAACLKAILERWEAPIQSLRQNLAGLSSQNHVAPNPPSRDASALGLGSSPTPNQPPPVLPGSAMAVSSPSPQTSPRHGIYVPPPPSKEDLAAMGMELLKVAAEGNLMRVKQLHAMGANLNFYDGGAMYPTPLRAAAELWKLSYNSSQGFYVQDYAIVSVGRSTASRFEVINYLLNHGAALTAIPQGPTRLALLQALREQAQRHQESS